MCSPTSFKMFVLRPSGSVLRPSAADPVLDELFKDITKLSSHPNVLKFREATFRHRSIMKSRNITDEENQKESERLDDLNYGCFMRDTQCTMDPKEAERKWYQQKLDYLQNLTTKKGLKAELKKLNKEAKMKIQMDCLMADFARQAYIQNTYG